MVGPKGTVVLSEGVIVAQRHIHMTAAEAAAYGVTNGQTVSIEFDGPRCGVLGNVAIRAGEGHALECHVDTEEANAYKYAYLTYDSTRLSIGFITSISDMSNRTWDNNYHGNPWIGQDMSNGMSAVSTQTKEFDTHNTKPEKIEKIKFFTSSLSGKYTISIITNDNTYNNIATLNTTDAGIHTVDLSNKNIIIDDNTFSVKITGESAVTFFKDSVSVFTSNVDTTPVVTTYSTKAYDSTKPLSDENPLYVSGDNYWSLSVSTYLKNIPSNSNLTYRVQKDGVIATENIEQAIERSGTKAGNKGYDCALGAIEMVNLMKQIKN